jgi:hypothetical protein
MSFNFLTKLGAFETVDFLLQASTRRRKEEAGEGGGGGSPPWAAMAARSKPSKQSGRAHITLAGVYPSRVCAPAL